MLGFQCALQAWPCPHKVAHGESPFSCSLALVVSGRVSRAPGEMEGVSLIVHPPQLIIPIPVPTGTCQLAGCEQVPRELAHCLLGVGFPGRQRADVVMPVLRLRKTDFLGLSGLCPGYGCGIRT